MQSNYILANTTGMEPRLVRVLQDLTDRINSMSAGIELASRVDLPTRQEVPEGIISIPCRDAGGIDGAVRVNKDGAIINYISPTESLFPYEDITVVGTVGGGIDPLHTFRLLAGTLGTNGDSIKFVYAGTFATNANTKRVQILFDGQVFEDFGNFAFATGVWVVIGDYTRVSQTTVRATSIAMYGEPLVMDEGVVSGTPDIIYLPRNTLLTVSNLNTTAVVLQVTGSGTADNDVVQNKSKLEYVKPRTVKSVP